MLSEIAAVTKVLTGEEAERNFVVTLVTRLKTQKHNLITLFFVLTLNLPGYIQ